MSYLAAFVGLVALVQGVAWLRTGMDASERGKRAGPRLLMGSLLAPLGLVIFALALTSALIPDLFS